MNNRDKTMKNDETEKKNKLKNDEEERNNTMKNDEKQRNNTEQMMKKVTKTMKKTRNTDEKQWKQ